MNRISLEQTVSRAHFLSVRPNWVAKSRMLSTNIYKKVYFGKKNTVDLLPLILKCLNASQNSKLVITLVPGIHY